MDDIILRVKDICKYYPGVKALDGVNFEVKRGEVHAICGENGAGKSTFIKILTGANEPTSGTIEFNGKEYTTYEATQRMRQLETLMRKERLDVHLLKKAGAENEQVKEARAKYRKTSAEYREFTEAMGMKEQRERVTVDGLGRV